MDTRNGRTQYALTFSSIPNNPCPDVALPSGHASLANPSSSSPTNQDGGIRDVSTNGRAASTSRKGPEEQCKVCMWTGVATCTGLSAYFLKQAYLDLPETGTSEVMKHAQRQRRFLFVLAGASGVAGAYRFYLG
eukprot:CAMPEP_0185809328 /NCGR_PEP_ID=MMETSP1322-20130828/6143_1 /TAXON_ID=265543 /ORGANISM="Minutocellus polymorphus, Strain RCC2270" /LENGTH=133 /DNA_ID=CAMNT_0028505593 /DNA_START=125 /DNA_END=526 /DNA_ORIENTATION=+